MEDLLNVTMEERRKMNEMKIVIIEKLGRLEDHEQEIAQIHIENKKLTMTQMKMELEMDKLKEDMEMEKLRLEQMNKEKEIIMMDVSVLPLMQQEYIYLRQKEIL